MADATTFDLFEFLSGAAYPEDDVRVYTDRKAVYELDKIETEISNERDSARADELHAKSEAIKESIRATSLTFKLRGLPTPLVQDVDNGVNAKFGNEVESDEKNLYRMVELLRLHILEVTRADGAKDTREWNHDGTKALIEEHLPTSQASKLLSAVGELTMRSRSFEDYEVTPDFS